GEVRASVGDDGMYVERCVEGVRHVEAQIAVDESGRGICLGERECSIQRRNQKMIEEAPSASISESLRQDIAKLAVDAAVRSGYRNVGTFEFLVDEQNKAYFIEVNSRIQVEHTVTEMTTGMDLVKEQIALAAGAGRIHHRRRHYQSSCRPEDPRERFVPLGTGDDAPYRHGRCRRARGLSPCEISPLAYPLRVDVR